MDRRGFIGAILAAGVAPALARASSLMPIFTPVHVLCGDGSRDDSAALQAWLDGGKVMFGGALLGDTLRNANIRLDDAVRCGRFAASPTYRRISDSRILTPERGSAIIMSAESHLTKKYLWLVNITVAGRHCGGGWAMT